MTLTKIENEIRTIVGNLGWTLWFGTKSNYNTKRDIGVREVIVEPPNTIKIINKGCYYDTRMSLWVGVRRKLDSNQNTTESEFIDSLMVDVKDIYNEIQKSDFILITQNIETIEFRYIEANSSATVNHQSFITFTVPVRIWNK